MKQRIAIHSVPRSGSTWLGCILDAHPKITYKFQPLFSYKFKGRLNENSSRDEIMNFFEELSLAKDNFLDQLVAKKNGIVPNFLKSSHPEAVLYKEVRYHHILENLMLQDDEIKVIGIIRSPLSVIHSWWKAPKEFRKEKGWCIEKEWRFAPSKNLEKKEEFNGYEKWGEVSLLFEHLKLLYPDRFYLLEYRDLLNDTEEVIRGIFEFINIEIADSVLDFINESKCKNTKDPYGVYKEKLSDEEWKGKLPQSIVEGILKDLEGSNLKKYL